MNPAALKSVSLGASSGRRGEGRLIAGLVWFHRWLGIATCLVFTAWFASGAILVFKPFPSLPQPARLEYSAPLQLDRIQVGPADALVAAGVAEPASLRLIERAGRPAYIIDTGGTAVAIDAETGRALPLLDRRAVGAAEPPIDYDQWIVHNGLDRYRPVYRLAQGDDAGTMLYVSARTGEAVQRTTASDRAWNWPGAVLHWVYFTPLRESFTAWDRTVWGVSLVAMLVAFAGIILGLIRTATALAQRKPSLSFYRLKWMRWHHILGLFSGLFVFAWILSGWLSMDHGRIFSRGTPAETEAAAYRGGALSAIMSGVDPAALAKVGSVSEIEFNAVGGAPLLTIRRANGVAVRADALARPMDDSRFREHLVEGIKAAWPGARPADPAPVAAGDFYAQAESWPASAMRVRLGGDSFPDVYVDSQTGRLLTVMDGSRATYEWVYYALHTFKFPGLAERPTLRRIIILIPLLFGLAFSITGVVIGWKRLRKPQPRKKESL